MPLLAIQNYTSLDLHKQRIFRKVFKLPQKYIFYPSTYLPHKNHITFIDSLRLLKKKLVLKEIMRIEKVSNNNEFNIFFQIINRYQKFLRLFKN